MPNSLFQKSENKQVNPHKPLYRCIECILGGLYNSVCLFQSPLSCSQYVGLLDEMPGFESQARHQNEIRKVFLRHFPLSRFLAKTLRVNKIAIKSFSKKLSFGVDFKLQVPPLMYKINTHNISSVRNQVNNPD